MIATGDSYLAAGNGTKAGTSYQRALSIAGAIRSDRANEIRTKMKDIAAVEAATRKLKSMEDKLKADPGNMAVRMVLINHHLLEMDNPIEAHKLGDKRCR